MSGKTSFRRASNLLYRSIGASSRDGALTAVDLDAMARTMAFVTSIARVSVDPVTDILEGPPPQYTVAEATSLADLIRRRLDVSDEGPLFDLPDRLPAQLSTFVFPIDTAALSSASVVFEETRFIFVSSRLGSDQLSECARALATTLALVARRRAEDTALIETFSSLSRGVGPRAYFATNFAARLLVPTRGLATSLQKVRELLEVKREEIGDIELLYIARIFGVRFADVVRRCERERLLPPGGARSMERFIDEKFQGPENRAAQLGLPPCPAVSIPAIPHVLLSVLRSQIEDDVVSVSDAAFGLGTTEAQLKTFLGGKTESPTSESLWQ